MTKFKIIIKFKLAMESTFWSLEKIGEIVNRNHATAIHSRSMFDEIMQNKEINVNGLSARIKQGKIMRVF